MYTEGKRYRVQGMYIQKVGDIESKGCIKKERVQCMYTEGREIGPMYVCRR